jgi:mono/diheme cytochrome c family protein
VRPAAARGAFALLAASALAGTVAAAGCSDGGVKAAEAYRAHCARCHGADGRGDRRSVGLYPNLDLTSSTIVRAGSRGRGLIYQRISDGWGAMPGFSHRLEREDIEDLVDYVLRLPQGKASR